MFFFLLQFFSSLKSTRNSRDFSQNYELWDIIQSKDTREWWDWTSAACLVISKRILHFVSLYTSCWVKCEQLMYGNMSYSTRHFCHSDEMTHFNVLCLPEAKASWEVLFSSKNQWSLQNKKNNTNCYINKGIFTGNYNIRRVQVAISGNQVAYFSYAFCSILFRFRCNVSKCHPAFETDNIGKDRRSHKFNFPTNNTERYKRTFIPSMCI